jgi:hypothetical protein
MSVTEASPHYVNYQRYSGPMQRVNDGSLAAMVLDAKIVAARNVGEEASTRMNVYEWLSRSDSKWRFPHESALISENAD